MSLIGQAGVVSSTSKETFLSSNARFFTNPKVTISWFRSGSITKDRALKTSPCHSVGTGGRFDDEEARNNVLYGDSRVAGTKAVVSFPILHNTAKTNRSKFLVGERQAVMVKMWFSTFHSSQVCSYRYDQVRIVVL
jgi:hypothetical protein